MFQPAITVGVPVFNGAAFLAQSLDILHRQTFSNFEVLILDNASTDETPAISADFVARDPRFRYVRQPYNKGALVNFEEALAAASTPYFMWRAADDVSDLNYLEVLHGLLEGDLSKDLAVGRVESWFDGARVKEFLVPPLRGDHGLRDQNAMLFSCHPSWIYGLFRTQALVDVTSRVFGRFGDDPRAWDNLALMPFILDFRIASSDATCFRQALRSGLVRFGDHRPRRVEADFDEVMAHRARFLEIGREFVDERYPPGLRRMAVRRLAWRYGNRNAYKLKHIIRRTARRWIGLRP